MEVELKHELSTAVERSTSAIPQKDPQVPLAAVLLLVHGGKLLRGQSVLRRVEKE